MLSDHPNARGQKRRVEEKGAFGKTNRRKGSSRTRTATPAKKENPIVESFDKAITFDVHKQATSSPDSNPLLRGQDVTMAGNKEPTEVILFGYSTNSQYEAIRIFEKVSMGMICEDYDREPPAELRRYPSMITQSPRNRSRPLTKEERAKVFRYAGGAHWVKVTFDSAETAERAMSLGAAKVYGHWVFAQPWHGVNPEVDEPIPMTEEEQKVGKFLRKMPQRGGASQALQSQPDGNLANGGSITSTTASSGTATGLDQTNLRNRNQNQGVQAGAGAQNPRMMRFFPDQQRTVLRPAHEALLPQPTWWERQLRWLSDNGLIPGEIIGNGPPVDDNGNFVHERASFYWRFFYWIDSTFGTDYCGLKDDDEE